MKQYNRALDYTVLALAELSKGNGVLAARLLATAVKQSDIKSAISILEASNKQAFELSAKARLSAGSKVKASDEGMEEETTPDPELEVGDDVVESDVDFGADPLDDVEDSAEDEAEPVEEDPGTAMAKVLSKMVRQAGRK
jgi:hypothetical protein